MIQSEKVEGINPIVTTDDNTDLVLINSKNKNTVVENGINAEILMIRLNQIVNLKK